MESKLAIRKPPVRRHRWFERLMAIIATINFALVLLDLSYIPWRDFYLREIPSLIQVYDPIKGIEPHRETQAYLNRVNKLEQQVMQTGLESAEVESLLQDLRSRSNEMIEDNPFALAKKSGALEKIKNQVRDRVGKESAHQAFNEFWSQAYLSQAGCQQELNFFNTETRPLIQTNYYLSLGINGKFIDKFWLIDLPFTILFALEFLVRTFYISRQYPNFSWLQGMLRRWYDVFLLLPLLRWVRVIPVMVRLYQSELLNFEPVRQQINHDFVANFAEELTEIMGIQVINQMQGAIQRGDLARWLFQPGNHRPYININNTNEVQAIAARLINLSVHNVLPKIQPDLEALVHHTLESNLKEFPVFQQFQNVPVLSHLPSQIDEDLAKSLSQTAFNNALKAVEDPVVAELTTRLIDNFGKALEVELQKKHNFKEIESLLIDMLEEIKVNYVKGIAESGMDKILDEAEQLHLIVRQ